MVTGYEVSPDGRTLAFRENYNLFVTPFFGGAQHARRRRARHRPAGHPGHHQRRHLSELDDATAAARLEPRPDALHRRRRRPDPQRPGRHRLQRRRPPAPRSSITVPADVPTGLVALVGARIVTMANADGGIIDDGVILIDGNRIRAVGRARRGRHPRRRAACRRRRQDDHPRPDRRPRPWPAGRGRPRSRSRTGRPCRTSPWASPPSTTRRARRARSSPPPRCSAPASSSRRAPSRRARSSTAPARPSRYALIDSYDDALAHVRRLRRRGRPFDQELQPAAPQPAPAGRRRRAGREHPRRARGRLAVPDGHHPHPGRQFDGRAQYPAARASTRMCVSLWSQTRVGYNPTLVVTYGGLAGDPYWTQATPVWQPSPADPPHAARRARRPGARDDRAGRPVRRPVQRRASRTGSPQRGVPIAIGGHGQQPGIAEHWELWSHVRGGATPIEALRHGTVDPARDVRLHRPRHARARQARRPRHPRRRPDPGHPQHATISTR